MGFTIIQIKNRQMKTIFKIAVFSLAVLSLSFNTDQPSTWAVEKENANLGFTINHKLLSDVHGTINSFDAKITATKEDFSDAVVDFTADISSIDTKNGTRDKHLNGTDFFDAENYPQVTFRSNSFKKTGVNNYVVIGDLTMRGITKSVELVAVSETLADQTKTTFTVTGKLNRSDFGVGTSMAAGMISEEVTINANIVFAKN